MHSSNENASAHLWKISKSKVKFQAHKSFKDSNRGGGYSGGRYGPSFCARLRERKTIVSFPGSWIDWSVVESQKLLGDVSINTGVAIPMTKAQQFVVIPWGNSLCPWSQEGCRHQYVFAGCVHWVNWVSVHNAASVRQKHVPVGQTLFFLSLGACAGVF